ncbi:ribonuclease HI family protein [Loigolactobacillus bifermentans]|jgi:ribonuclease HI|uniref:Ribonuclease H n=1 Tax=Loigolactobacillus bifermentans DSM 20003 TaxID=1423726 RepID=A0A0R1GR46_9LACO|nr:ribonuclease HI family protein [Loigolactobacillus bifermentans]KRK34305.1 ribonuclease H [Loigolactobacillus bifermentans DSM 20003]QGG59413.1 reverse transcriptase-like protein [Loigolactobacillus bifermentans]
MLYLATDAATKGNPGPSGAGIVIHGDAHYLQLYTPLPVSTNHEAEFAAVQFGFETLIARGWTTQTVCLQSDSRIVITSLEKGYAKHYQPQVDRILALEAQLPLVLHEWRSDHANRKPHELAQTALFNQLSTKK